MHTIFMVDLLPHRPYSNRYSSIRAHKHFSILDDRNHDQISKFRNFCNNIAVLFFPNSCCSIERTWKRQKCILKSILGAWTKFQLKMIYLELNLFFSKKFNLSNVPEMYGAEILLLGSVILTLKHCSLNERMF